MADSPKSFTRASVRRVSALMMALVGVLIFTVLLVEDVGLVPQEATASLPWKLITQYAAAMAVGGAVAGALLSGLFGKRGVGGWLLAAVGGIVASTVAGLLGSAVGLLPSLLRDGFDMGDLIAVGFGAALAPIALIGNPLRLAVWVLLIALTHLWCQRIRHQSQVA
ncbi:hypothetical protein ACRDNQ_07810 [Palleronia sp. KMU-117]|uniref:hypothetical protein n=1 Tax=Palleronia sp. KMU-117 TaxID=3434108 RepID=UPI003D714B20